MHVQNPVLPGCFPDPSCCRVGDWYYLATSSFHYWPGLPLFRSRDLINWESIGHAIDRAEQMDLADLAPSQGLFAPTLRFHGGRLWLICTRVAGERAEWRNFIVTAEDPAGPWSDPVWVEPPSGVDPGIDPSLSWDENGTCWICGNRRTPNDDREIWLQRWDHDQQCLLDEPLSICRGSCGHGVEGPHLYRIGDYWYLITAEGGTGPQHAVACYRSRAITGPYEACPNNPLLTHRHLGADHPIVNPGHTDIIPAPDGSWAALLLASRQLKPGYTPIGRETWLVPVIWENGWPVFSPGDGQVREEVDVSWSIESTASAARDHAWHTLRTPEDGEITVSDNTVTLVPGMRHDMPHCWLRRCTDPSWRFSLRLPDAQSDEVSAGILVVHNDVCQFRVVRQGKELIVERRDRAGRHELYHGNLPAKETWLRLEAEADNARAQVSPDGERWTDVGKEYKLDHLTPRFAWGFVGTSVGCMADSVTQSEPVAFTDVTYSKG